MVSRCLEKNPDARYPDASALRNDLERFAARWRRRRRARRSQPGRRRRWIAIAAAAALIVGLAGTWWYRQSARQRWVRNDALPGLAEVVERIQGLQEGRESWDAFVLARSIEAATPRDPLVEQLRPKFSGQITITSEPAGATVSAWYYDDPDAPPIVLGTTPLKESHYPRGFTRLRLTLAGRPNIDDVIWNFGLVGDAWHYTLDTNGAVPNDMVRFPPASSTCSCPGSSI